MGWLWLEREGPTPSKGTPPLHLSNVVFWGGECHVMTTQMYSSASRERRKDPQKPKEWHIQVGVWWCPEYNVLGHFKLCPGLRSVCGSGMAQWLDGFAKGLCGLFRIPIPAPSFCLYKSPPPHPHRQGPCCCFLPLYFFQQVPPWGDPPHSCFWVSERNERKQDSRMEHSPWMFLTWVPSPASLRVPGALSGVVPEHRSRSVS